MVGVWTRPPAARRRVTAAVVALIALAGCARVQGGATLSGSPTTAAVAATTTLPVDPGIEDLMVGAGMTDRGRRLFLQAQPSIEDRDTLAQSCAGVDSTGGPEGSHTFGCVADGRVHVRAFGAPEIRELSYVVAAHELLHLVYRRMVAAERGQIDAELDAARAGNAVLEERLQVYAAAGEDTRNEVHSVLGTEFSGLSPVLETHYTQYFSRDQVLAAFQRTLGGREEAIRTLQAKVDDTEALIEPLESRMNALEAAGDLRTYNANVPVINALVADHNAALRQLRQQVDEYNALLAS